MEVISVTVESRNGKSVGLVELIETPSIASTIVLNVNGTSSEFTLREGKKGPLSGQPTNTFVEKYIVTGLVKEITDLSDNLFTGTIVTIKGRPSKYPSAGFNINFVSGYIKPDTAGSRFFYQEDSDPELVEYVISETPAEILLQLQTNAVAILNPTDIHYADLVALQNSSTMVYGYYRITDFRTTHIIPSVPESSSVDPVHVGRVEPLIVFATSSSTLDKKAYSQSNSDDYIEYDLIDLTSANPENTTQHKSIPIVSYGVPGNVIIPGIWFSGNVPVGLTVTISDSTHNNGTYHILSSGDAGGGNTKLTLVEPIPNAADTDGIVNFTANYVGVSKGRIYYRKNYTKNVSTFYDFRNVVFYHPTTQYTGGMFTDGLGPYTLNYVTINGSQVADGNVFPDAVSLFNYMQEQYHMYATYDGSNTFVFLSKSGYEFGDMAVSNSIDVTETMGGVITKKLFYTFGNILNIVTLGDGTGVITPAGSGDRIESHFDCNIGIVTDMLSTSVLNNIILGIDAILVDINPECLDIIISNGVSLFKTQSLCSNILSMADSSTVNVGIQNVNIIITSEIEGLEVGDNITSALNETLNTSGTNTVARRKIVADYSNLDVTRDITGITNFIFTNKKGVGKFTVGTTTGLGLGSIDTLTDFNTNHPVRFYPRGTFTALTFVHGLGAGQPRCSGGVSAVLDGTKGDWIEFTLLPDGFIYQTDGKTY